MATHSSILDWRIPGTGEPGGMPSMGSHRVGHDWSDLAAAAAADKNHIWSYAENEHAFWSLEGVLSMDNWQTTYHRLTPW